MSRRLVPRRPRSTATQRTARSSLGRSVTSARRSPSSLCATWRSALYATTIPRRSAGKTLRSTATRWRRWYWRKSGDARTGVKAEDKRGGGGKGNWGTFEDDPKEGDETANNTSVEEAPVDGEAPAEGEAKEDAPAEDKEPVEEEMKTLTLDEWKAQQKKEAPKFNVRKAGEGSDIDPKWKKATSYKKVNEEQSEEEEEETVVYLQRANRQKKP